jgi:hypothetical protein
LRYQYSNLNILQENDYGIMRRERNLDKRAFVITRGNPE